MNLAKMMIQQAISMATLALVTTIATQIHVEATIPRILMQSDNAAFVEVGV